MCTLSVVVAIACVVISFVSMIRSVRRNKAQSDRAFEEGLSISRRIVKKQRSDRARKIRAGIIIATPRVPVTTRRD